MKPDQWPKHGSTTETEVNRRIAAAVESEHAAGSKERLAAVLAAVKAEREACAQIADTQFFGVAKAIRARKDEDHALPSI